MLFKSMHKSNEIKKPRIKHMIRVVGTCILFKQGGGVSHCGLAIYIKKYLKAKEEELWKLKYFTMQKYNLKKTV
jgi:hypothetical protein